MPICKAFAFTACVHFNAVLQVVDRKGGRNSLRHWINCKPTAWRSDSLQRGTRRVMARLSNNKGQASKMSEIDALQQRLTAAMDRITTGLGQLDSAGTEDMAALQAALDDERTANAQLNERVRKMTESQEAALAEAKGASEAAQARVSEMDLELQRLRAANDQLRESNVALRSANEEGVGEPHLINKAMLAELESLRATRAADVAEASSIIGALTPLLNQIEVQGEENSNA